MRDLYRLLIGPPSIRFKTSVITSGKVISTEGALRLSTTFDNHPIQPTPIVQPTKNLLSSKQALDWSELTSNGLRWPKMIWLHSDYILTAFWIKSDYILTTAWLHSYYILTTFWIHPDYILTTFSLHSDYIVATCFNTQGALKTKDDRQLGILETGRGKLVHTPVLWYILLLLLLWTSTDILRWLNIHNSESPCQPFCSR